MTWNHNYLHVIHRHPLHNTVATNGALLALLRTEAARENIRGCISHNHFTSNVSFNEMDIKLHLITTDTDQPPNRHFHIRTSIATDNKQTTTKLSIKRMYVKKMNSLKQIH